MPERTGQYDHTTAAAKAAPRIAVPGPGRLSTAEHSAIAGGAAAAGEAGRFPREMAVPPLPWRRPDLDRFTESWASMVPRTGSCAELRALRPGWLKSRAYGEYPGAASRSFRRPRLWIPSDARAASRPQPARSAKGPPAMFSRKADGRKANGVPGH